VGILLRSGQYFGQPEVEQNAPVTVAAPPPSAVAATPAVETTEFASPNWTRMPAAVAISPPPAAATHPRRTPTAPTNKRNRPAKQSASLRPLARRTSTPSPGYRARA
jgi:hypothetical protein